MGALQSALTTERRLRRVDLENIPPARASLVVEAVLTEKKSGKDGAEDNNDANDSTPVLSKEQLLRIQIKLPAITDQRMSKTQTHLVLVVDKSGSMSGNPWTQVQASVKDIIGRSVKQSSVKTDLILYNDKAHVIEFTADNYEKVITDLKAGGMTSFNAAFTKVNRVITEAGGDYSRTVIVFMTDGADTVSPKEMLPKMAGTLAKRWQEINKEVTIHAVGFTSSHDFKFLKNLAENGGTTPGMFRYCEPGEDKQALKHKLDELFDFILDYDDDDIKIGMSMEGNDNNYFLGADNPGPTTVVQGKITPQPAEEAGNGDIIVEGEAWVQLPDPYSMPEIVVNVTATVSLEEGKVPVTLPCVVEKTDFQVLDEADEKVCWRLKILNRNVDMFIDKVGKTISENGDASSFQERIEKFQKQISHTRVFGNGITRERRDELFEMIQEIQKSLDQVQNMLAQYVRGGTQSISLLARAHDMRYQAVFSKSRRQRIMDKRAAKNIVQAASAQESLSSLIVNKEEVDKLSQDAVDFYFCMLSQNTIQDILLGEDNDDTIGFGLAVKRNEVVLDEPTLIQIWVISGTLVSRTAMLDALEHKINVSSHLSAHGGFDFANTQLGVTTVGTSREPINAWLPLYVTKSHWDRVKVILKPALGSFCTLDPLGYDYKQMDVMFMTLGSMIGQLKKGVVGEHQLKLLFALLRTCAACLEDFEMTDTVVEFVEKFVASPAGRTKDVIPNLFTLIGYIVSLPTERTWKLFCMEGDAKSKLPKLWLGFIAECLRRAAGNLYRDSSKNKLNGLIDAILHGTGQGILASSQEPAEVAVCGAAAEITRLCLQSDTEEVEVASFDPANDVKVPEMEVCHSEKVDRAMETWAEREAGFISNKAQKKQVSDAKKVVLKWVKEGHDALGIETTESDQSNKNTGTDNKSKNNTVKSTSSNKDDAKASTSKADNEEITNSEEEGSKEERHFGSDYDPNYVTSSMLNILVQLHNKLCKVAYPTMQSLPGCIAFVNAWLSKNRNLSDIDNNSGLVPKEWINEIKEAITNMSTSIEDFTARSLICVEVSDAMATTVQDSSDLNTTQTVNAEQDAVSRLQEAGNQEVLVVPDEQLSGNQQVQTGITNTVKDNEQVNGNANVDNEEDDSDDSFEEFMDDDSDDETASEARRTMRKKQKKTKKDDKKITVPMILHCIDSDLDITLLLRALVSQAVRFHSNSAARSAITTGQLVDLGEGASCASSTLKLCHQGLQEHRDTVRKGMLDQALWKRANYCMVHASTVWAFIGYLMNTHKDRGEGFNDLIDLFVATSQTCSIPYLEKKVHVLLTGSYKDCTVFANGNQWLPEKKMAAIFKTLLGEEKWLDFETELRSAVQIHVYRESDIPNRHGHCNSNPYIPNALRLKLGMALLPEKKGGATGNRKKLKNSKTR